MSKLFFLQKTVLRAVVLLPLAAALIFSACAKQEQPAEAKLPVPEVSESDKRLIESLPEKTLTFNDIRPVLEKRCIVCHGCYDAPCQLKLSSHEGVTRGANKLKVYNKMRFSYQAPTRLFIDANSTEAWRQKQFFSVLNDDGNHSAEENLKRSLLYQMLNLKQHYPMPDSGPLPADMDISLDREQVCTRLDSFGDFADKHRNWGMPYAVPNLSEKEYKQLVQWLAQGAQPSEETRPSAEAVAQVRKWEAFFNGSSLKERLVSRYIYEHLVLGHLHFEGTGREFYRLVRSRTETGAIAEIPSVRPYDDPEGSFYYRLRLYDASIVEKSHIVYELSDARMARYRELFLEPDYKVTKLPPYNPPEASDKGDRFWVKVKKLFGLYDDKMLTPFTIFREIPAQVRYQFLLDDARFFINGFIKGPVCRGLSALSAIEDHFWLFFLKPENPPAPYSQHGLDGEFLADMDQYLHLPTELADTSRLFAGWIKYWPDEQKYMQAKLDYYRSQKLPRLAFDKALDDFVWNGVNMEGEANRNAALTVFRHFDSASVHYGMQGGTPETAWFIDYPVFERLHYLLVAGYNPFGTLGHQLGARLYMDFMRIEGEDNFLYFLPMDDRELLYYSWHKLRGKTSPEQRKATRAWLKVDSVGGYSTQQEQPPANDEQKMAKAKRSRDELFKNLKQHLSAVESEWSSPGRNERSQCADAASDRAMQRVIDSLHNKVLKNFPEVSFVRVKGSVHTCDRAYTLIRNKSYREDSFAKPGQRSVEAMQEDTFTLIKGLAGSYPNFFFDLNLQELDAFVAASEEARTELDYRRVLNRYGIRRSNPEFWEMSDWFQGQHVSAQPVEAGILDLSRYMDPQPEDASPNP
ncbi:fatty acid cis/trans isomerase [Mariprofundus ferrinatatus]|uniref:fatty acid cis/trans isomerase n=1 Tax=Mariprofundus ferrinatatus TaxID=1921087 RepID=UPI0018E1EEFB|nr:fatty acid cis/trans isomerase [Mariprofundus ferrinatatus]